VIAGLPTPQDALVAGLVRVARRCTMYGVHERCDMAEALEGLVLVAQEHDLDDGEESEVGSGSGSGSGSDDDAVRRQADGAVTSIDID
jgi:hypothetical protein